ncbi:MAG TPA: NADPH:quinone reductase [candidate division Zixibacteria bacterium]|nr:NADPH:quinone reductase [candidate division Zixibacteria bacterium]
MKAIQVSEFGGPEQLVLRDIPEPKPKAGEVLVRIHAAGVNPADTYMRTGTYAVKPALPYTPGMDGAGEVLAVGSGVTSFKPGDRVYVGGPLCATYAEQTACVEQNIHPLPQKISFKEGAALGVPYATAYRALFQKARMQADETVLVNGASGGVGLAAVQLAKAHGATVIGTAGTERGSKLVKDNGADHVLDHSSPDLAKQIHDLTGGKGPNVILEMLANVNLARDLQIIGRYGRIVIIGNRGSIEINPRDAMARDAIVYGMVLFNATPQDQAEIHAGLARLMTEGRIKPVIGTELPLGKAREAHEQVMKPGSYGKIILIP